MKIKWIKISTDMFDDEKIAIISSMPEANAMLVIWIRLLALAGKTNDGGSIYFDEGIPYTDEMLSTIFRQPLNVVRLSLQTFEKFRMIERHEDQIYITNWEKHQNIEVMERIRLLNAERVRKHRERKQIGECNVTVTNCNAPDKNRLDKKENIKNGTHTPNSLEETKAYFQEIGHFPDAEKFYDYFSSNGWKVGGKTPMRDWKAAARNWTRNSKNFTTKEQKHESGIDRINRIAAEARRKALPVNS